MDKASPKRLWIWAVAIAIVGLAARAAWYLNFEDQLLLLADQGLALHDWTYRYIGTPGGVGSVDTAAPYYFNYLFQPGTGMLLNVFDLADGSFSSTQLQALLAIQSSFVFAATLAAFALARRVLFGWSALLVPALMTASLALVELPAVVSPQILAMCAVVISVWLLAIAHERKASDERVWVFVLLAGLVLTYALVTYVAIWLLLVGLVWWAVRGIGWQYTVLLVLVALLLPAFGAATEIVENTTRSEQIEQRLDAGNVVEGGDEVAERVTAFFSPWTPAYSEGTYSADRWSYENLLPASVRDDYRDTLDILAIIWVAVYVLLVLGGAWALINEAAGSVGRLLLVPLITVPLATFLDDAGNAIRVAILPFLTIAISLGLVWLKELLASHDDANG